MGRAVLLREAVFDNGVRRALEAAAPLTAWRYAAKVEPRSGRWLSRTFSPLEDARAELEAWRHYNASRRRSALGHLMPQEFSDRTARNVSS
jgi:transposase InsO family protein